MWIYADVLCGVCSIDDRKKKYKKKKLTMSTTPGVIYFSIKAVSHSASCSSESLKQQRFVFS